MRIAAFTEVAATAIASTEARRELRELADEQAAPAALQRSWPRTCRRVSCSTPLARGGHDLGADFPGTLSTRTTPMSPSRRPGRRGGDILRRPARSPTCPGNRQWRSARQRLARQRRRTAHSGGTSWGRRRLPRNASGVLPARRPAASRRAGHLCRGRIAATTREAAMRTRCPPGATVASTRRSSSLGRHRRSTNERRARRGRADDPSRA